METTGIRIEDFMMMIQETPTENWWASARAINPEMGFDSRTSAPTQN